MKSRLFPLLAVALLVLGAAADHLLTLGSHHAPPAVAASATTFAAAPAASTIDQATEHAYGVASPSVVYVVSQGVGSGSGVIYNTQGDIVTNDHVVAGASGLRVTLSNGRSYRANLVGTDQADDLAVIKIAASGLVPAHFAAASSYQVAATVLAIGSPLGLKDSVTSGLVSGLQRVEQEPNGAYLPNAIQTSAPINPGNSGGALVTLDGAVIGMPTLEQVSAQNGSSAQSIGFAIPSTRIVSIANQIIAHGKVSHTGRAYLGIAPTDPSAAASPFGQFGGSNGPTTITSGAYVARVAANGPAGKAGVQQGDVITAVKGTSVSDAQDLLTILAQQKPGDTLTLTVNRNGKTLSIRVHLGELPA